MKKIEKMGLFLKQSLENENISEKEINDKITSKIESNQIIDKKILPSFWGKYSTKNLDIYYLWNEFKDILINKINLNKKNKYQYLLSSELLIFLTRLINIKNKINFNQISNFLDFEYINIQNIFVSIINCLDKINLIPIIMKQTEKDKEKAIKINQKKFWHEFDIDDLKFLNKVRKYTFKNTFFKNFFSLEIDKINFYGNFLLEARNQNTHYPINNFEICNDQELDRILENIIKKSNEKILTKQKMICQEYKRSIVLATLYLFLVYEAMIKINIEDFELYFSNKSRNRAK